MTVSFNIEYRTSWGEEVRIAGLLPESIPMHTTDGIYWTADVELEAVSYTHLTLPTICSV